jgi:hypothetical protein
MKYAYNEVFYFSLNLEEKGTRFQNEMRILGVFAGIAGIHGYRE